MGDNNIYSIDNWAANTQYYKNKILTNNNLYYYVTNNYTSDPTSIDNDLNNGNLNGYIWNQGVSKPYFFWKHSYRASNESEPKIKLIQFGDSYSQRTTDGINSLLLNYSLSFENRDLHEITAILHFLTIRNSVESFAWQPPAPRGNIARFYCPKWTDVQEFFGNYSIQANFIQTPV